MSDFKHSVVIILFVLAFFQASAQLHTDVLPGLNGNALITELRNEYKPAVVLSYSNARRQMYSDIYNVNDSVECVYSGFKLPLNPSDPDPINTLFNGRATGINCEHTFPQSKGADFGNARSDMHHLFPARGRVNEARLNYPFDEIPDNQTDRWFLKDGEQGSTPNSNIDSYSESTDGRFEPRESHKGNAARAVFYFYTMYRETADASFFSIQRKTLCQWHLDDPVDPLEWDRNELIARHQSNKVNPFVLDCSLALRTYCPDFTANCIPTSTDDQVVYPVTVMPNPSTGRLVIETELKLDAYTVYSVNGSLIEKGQFDGEKYTIHIPLKGWFNIVISGSEISRHINLPVFIQ